MKRGKNQTLSTTKTSPSFRPHLWRVGGLDLEHEDQCSFRFFWWCLASVLYVLHWMKRLASSVALWPVTDHPTCRRL